MKKSCVGFCLESRNTNKGLVAIPVEGLNFDEKKEIFKGKTECPLGFTCNPISKEGALNVIANGGLNTICHRNPWKWGAKSN